MDGWKAWRMQQGGQHKAQQEEPGELRAEAERDAVAELRAAWTQL